jgi:starch synthase
MNILFVTSEVFPYAKTGGLADVVYALAVELVRRGNRVIIVTPKYGFLENHKDLHPLKKQLSVTMGIRYFPCSLKKSKMNIEQGVLEFIFIDYDPIFGRSGIYSSEGELDFSDNILRFGLLSKAALEYCRLQHYKPDIIHTHDWPGVLSLFYARYGEGIDFFDSSATVFTIHNIGYQGVFDIHEFDVLGLPENLLDRKTFIHYGKINLLKAGILQSDIVTTVSPHYAEEIKTGEFGFGLETFIQSKQDRFTGILNGIDYKTWNPESDPYLPESYSADDLSGKFKMKTVLQKRMGLPPSDVPTLGMVSRLVEQKGFGELCRPGNSALYNLCNSMDIYVLILGTGEKWIQDELIHLESLLPNLRVKIGYDEELAHLIEGGSDFFLMPSTYEPCGLNQMYSLRYGTIPIVRSTGGLADTVEPVAISPGGSTGTGFVIHPMDENSNGSTLIQTVRTAVDTYWNQPHIIKEIRIRGMKKRFSWEESASRYEEIYRKAMEWRQQW